MTTYYDYDHYYYLFSKTKAKSNKAGVVVLGDVTGNEAFAKERQVEVLYVN